MFCSDGGSSMSCGNAAVDAMLTLQLRGCALRAPVRARTHAGEQRQRHRRRCFWRSSCDIDECERCCSALVCARASAHRILRRRRRRHMLVAVL